MIFSDIAAVTGPQARPLRVRFYALTVLATVLQAAAIMTLIPFLNALFSGDVKSAWPWVGLLILELIGSWAADSAASRTGLRVGFHILDAVEKSGLGAIRRLDPGRLHSERASRLRDLVALGGTESVSVMVLLGSPLIHALVLTPLLGLLLFFVSWKLALVALVGALAMFLALTASARAVSRAEASYSEAIRGLNDKVFEFAWAQPTLRGSGVGTGTVDGVLRQSRSRGLRLLAWQIPGDLVFSIVLQLTLLAFGVTTGALYLNGELSGISAATMIVVLLRIVEVVGSLSLLATPTASATRTFREIREIVEEDRAAAGEGDSSKAAVGGSPELRLQDVGFTYPDGTPALEGVDAVLPAGGVTVVVGASGSGKSTLLDVLAGLREPTSGRVSVGGDAVPAGARLAGSSVVFQSTQLRPGTLRENIGAADDGKLVALAERSQLTELVGTLESGWDSRVGEGGNSLSGGERQRVGLARALAKPSGVLLVDEATSALDAITERAVVDALEQVRGERTVVIVTHRPALVSLADQVIVLDEGRIADSGKVDELLARGGVFADLWTRWRESEGWQV
ncbi:ABC transporter ATP-binding protein [Gordonia sp. X0973]|uniref:ABC transporter ATP-binding protein n=1 Tax=Gordonia sp. X0973 TaxID=2742602 RepID=UPI000F53F90F|nr:ABC transporter ATP-binding protein [Gordonia sp. X0973]QKT07322.1 ABC transporter ATP-binding protein [Gordonia sp. X0973]